MTFAGDDTDDPLDGLTVQGVNKSDDYTDSGYVVILHAPDRETVDAVLARWGWA